MGVCAAADADMTRASASSGKENFMYTSKIFATTVQVQAAE
jgi:hypothetical protein